MIAGAGYPLANVRWRTLTTGLIFPARFDLACDVLVFARCRFPIT
ncbi:hypothetical protein PHMEG_0005361 [Phytophthora megakarya]|uniref:Uncharacterized protein n=1 Tax=Phytophthora megakarya TaxID=4795 RepID=A0A225WRP3_9STRA|nr:hypothetical protein PHMEG_0005361 [Phytophthora megakarya]